MSKRPTHKVSTMKHKQLDHHGPRVIRQGGKLVQQTTRLTTPIHGTAHPERRTGR